MKFRNSLEYTKNLPTMVLLQFSAIPLRYAKKISGSLVLNCENFALEGGLSKGDKNCAKFYNLTSLPLLAEKPLRLIESAE